MKAPVVRSLCLMLALAGVLRAAEPTAGPRTVADLKQLCPDQLHELFTNAEIGTIPVGDHPGQVLYFNDKVLPRFRVWTSNLAWRGKYFSDDTYFANRWINGHRWLGSHHVVGTSWVDGKPSLILEYPRHTPIFGNMHDELRQIAPGLYLGIIYMRDPCPYFRGFFALEVPCNCK